MLEVLTPGFEEARGHAEDAPAAALALDAETVAALRGHRQRCEERAASLGLELRPDAYVFSESPDGSTSKIPDSVTTRYERLAARLGIKTTLHKLRHYSATELIIGGVDFRTVAGRRAYAGGGTTTLRTYTAWVSEPDQRAASGLGHSDAAAAAGDRTAGPRAYRSAAPVRGRGRGSRAPGRQGELTPGSVAPTAAELVAAHDVSVATARRAVALAKEWGVLVNDSHGRPHVAVRPKVEPVVVLQAPDAGEATASELLVGGNYGPGGPPLRATAGPWSPRRSRFLALASGRDREGRGDRARCSTGGLVDR
jgi:integrase